MKVTYSAAISRDGFIAREDGDVSWLDDVEIDQQETGLAEFFAEVDGLVMGRGSYDFIFDYGSWPYEDKPTWVCTSRELEPLPGAQLTVVDRIAAVMADAQARELEHLWLIGGGVLASGFVDEGLLTNVSLAEMPVALGTGIPLFARHELNDLAVVTRQETDKKGFRQIEIELPV